MHSEESQNDSGRAADAIDATRLQKRADRSTAGLDFVRTIVAEDLAAGTHGGRVATRFPPEPNGFLHIGHATSICLNFGVAEENGGTCNLRFDDTNPTTEDMRYAEAIVDDVRWLGFEWNELLYASDYFEQLYEWAEQLVAGGKAYVDSLSEEQIREYRGTIREAGRESPYRDRPVDENLDLFRRMRAGEFADGAHVLRAKIDMAHPNMKMRDPVLYRIKHATHYRTGDAWCIYPMYDYAHPLSDAIEHITHSLCTLEFENNRAIYDWLIESVDVPSHPRQYEFARLNLDYTVMSKRKLLRLVEEGHVDGWDDPRMPTLSGLRRRGVRPRAIRSFCDLVGIAKANSRVDIGKLEYAIREDLNAVAPRVMCVLRPLALTITNYPEGQAEQLEAPYYPHDIGKEGSRMVPFTRDLYIERDDFMEHPPPRFFRLAPGREVRLRYGYVVRCDEVVKDDAGRVVELRCSYDPETRGGATPDGRKIKGTIHWVSAPESIPAEVRLYDRLFSAPVPDDAPEDKEFTALLNPDSLEVVQDARIEPSVAGTTGGHHFQFERTGYFFTDPVDNRPDRLVLNRVVTLRDTWAKIAGTEAPPPAARESVAAPSEAPEGPTRADLRAQRRTADPELSSRYERYTAKLGLPAEDADVLTGERSLALFFDSAVAAYDHPREIAKWMVNRLLGVLDDKPVGELPFDGARFAALVCLVDQGTISASAGQEILQQMVESGEDPHRIVEARGLRQISDPAALEPIVHELIRAHPDKVDEYRGGRTGLLGFFIGQAMQATRGRANPELVRKIVKEGLDG